MGIFQIRKKEKDSLFEQTEKEYDRILKEAENTLEKMLDADFPKVEKEELIEARMLVLNCLEFTNQIKSAGLFSSDCNMEDLDMLIACGKAAYYFYGNRSPIVHSIFYGYLKHYLHRKTFLKDIKIDMHILKIQQMDFRYRWRALEQIPQAPNGMIDRAVYDCYNDLTTITNIHQVITIKEMANHDFVDAVVPILEKMFKNA